MQYNTIVKATRTCFAYPSQWDAWTATGHYLYLRYRGGIGTAARYDSREAFIASDWDDLQRRTETTFVVENFEHDEQLGDGFITLTEFCRRAGYAVAGVFVATAQVDAQTSALALLHRIANQEIRSYDLVVAAARDYLTGIGDL